MAAAVCAAILVALLLGGCPAPSGSLRPYALQIPSRLDPAKPLPLLIVLHGLGSSGAGVRRYYHTDALADELGMLIAYPEGSVAAGDDHWFEPTKRSWNEPDVAYLDALIDDLRAKQAIDPKRVYVAGLSNGGYMAYRYACERAERVAAIVVRSGVMRTDTSRCKPSEPVAVLHVHGTADRLLPYEGGLVLGTGPKVLSAHQSVEA
jgi:polyhydroxybutyrate depolymerase